MESRSKVKKWLRRALLGSGGHWAANGANITAQMLCPRGRGGRMVVIRCSVHKRLCAGQALSLGCSAVSSEHLRMQADVSRALAGGRGHMALTALELRSGGHRVERGALEGDSTLFPGQTGGHPASWEQSQEGAVAALLTAAQPKSCHRCHRWGPRARPRRCVSAP